jgi:hypothetical protein
MKERVLRVVGVLVLLSLLFVLQGCVPKGDKSVRSADTNSHPADLQDARYIGSGDTNARTEVITEGSYFKSSNVTTSDFRSRLTNHPVASQTNWRDCREIKSSGGIMYHVVIEHSAAYDYVDVQVKGADGNWSNAKTVRKD